MWKQLAAASFAFWFLQPCSAYAMSPYTAVQRGNTLYQSSDYTGAAEHYATAAERLPDTAEIHFNQGNALYKQGEYDNAVDHYTRAQSSTDRTLANRATYNLGNVRYQQALRALADPQEAMQLLRAAMTYYRDSLEGDPQHTDARYNLELAHRLLRQLQQEQQNRQAQQAKPDQEQQPPDQAQQQAGRERQDTTQPPQSQEQQEQQQQGRQQSQQQTSPEQQQATSQDAPQPPQEQRAARSEQDQQSAEALPASAELNQEKAQRLLDIIRERAREAEARRQQQHRARMRGRQVEKNW